MADTMRLYGVVADSIVDGPGYRAAIFAQGCPHACEGCHNPESHDFNGGRLWTIDEIEEKFTGNPLLRGITLTGGEPFEQAGAALELARRAKAKGLDVWAYSGYVLEELFERAKTDRDIDGLLRIIDVLVDGPFILARRSLELDYCGSGNQRLIDMPKTLAEGRVTLWTRPMW